MDYSVSPEETKLSFDAERDRKSATLLLEMIGLVANSEITAVAVPAKNVARMKSMHATLSQCLDFRTKEEELSFRLLYLTIKNDFLILQIQTNDSVMRQALHVTLERLEQGSDAYVENVRKHALNHLDSFEQVILHAIDAQNNGIRLNSDQLDQLSKATLMLKMIHRDLGQSAIPILQGIADIEKMLEPVLEYISAESRKNESAKLRSQYKKFVAL